MKLILSPAKEPVELTLYDVDPDTGLIQGGKPGLFLRGIDPALALALADIMRGPVGATPDISMTVTPLPAGQTPEVVKGGTPEAPSFELLLPKEPVGDGFGAIKYQNPNLDILLPGGESTQLMFNPSSVANDLKAPFSSHAFWDGEKIRPLAVKDVFLVKLTVGIVPLIVDGDIDFIVTPYIGIVPNEDNRAFAVAAGVKQTMTITYPIIAQQMFVDNGGLILLSPSVPARVKSASLSFYPVSIA